MNPLSIFSVILPIIEELPSVESGVIALFNAVKAMISGGISAPEVLGAVTQSMPAITAAVVANTPSAPTPAPAPAETVLPFPVSTGLIPQPSPPPATPVQAGMTTDQLNAQELATHSSAGAPR